MSCRNAPIETGPTMRYATLLNIEQADSFTMAEVKNPWQTGKTLQRYILVPRDSILPTQRPKGTLLRTPLQRVIPFSSVHASLIYDLGARDALIGLCDTAYVIHSILREDLRSGHLADMGSSMTPDAERLIAARPDALFVSPIEGNSYEMLSAAGIPLVQCLDYMETSALGRAEWMKFFGLLLGQAEQADSMFLAVETTYDSLRRAVGQEPRESRPRLLCDLPHGDSWYVPGGGSYLGRLYADAGADYAFAARKESGSVALTLEAVMVAAANADIWLVKYGSPVELTYKQLSEEVRGYESFRPWQKRHVYGCNTLATPYYEEVPFHPDRLLRDLISIMHPRVLPAHRTRYYTPLQ